MLTSGLCQIMKSPERPAMKFGLYPAGTKEPVLGNEGLIQIFKWELSLHSFRRRSEREGAGRPLIKAER